MEVLVTCTSFNCLLLLDGHVVVNDDVHLAHVDATAKDVC